MQATRFGPPRRTGLPIGVAAALNGAAASPRSRVNARGANAVSLAFATRPEVHGFAGLQALAATTFQEALASGLTISEHVARLVSLQQQMYSRLNDPSWWQSLAHSTDLTLLRGDLDRWNQYQANAWWSEQATSDAVQGPTNLQAWIGNGERVYNGAIAIAARIADTQLSNDLVAARDAFLSQAKDSLIKALQAVGSVGREVITQAGDTVKTGTDKVGSIFTSTAFRVVGVGVLALGGLALGIYMLKRSGLKANVAIPGLPVQAGVSGLLARRRRRRARRRT